MKNTTAWPEFWQSFTTVSTDSKEEKKIEPPIYEFLEVKKRLHCPLSRRSSHSSKESLLYAVPRPSRLPFGHVRQSKKRNGRFRNVGFDSQNLLQLRLSCLNVKWKDGKCIGVFDFDWSKEDYRLADIGYSLVISIAAWEAMIDGTMDMERVKAYLQGYHDYTKEYGILPPFTEEEKKAFPSFVLAGAIYLYHWSH